MQDTFQGELFQKEGSSMDLIKDEGAPSKMEDKFMGMVSDMQDEID